jgi:receptor protein-tyrosine kinase
MWQFDDEEDAEQPRTERLVDPDNTLADALQYEFGDSAAGRVVVGVDADPYLAEEYRRLGAVLHNTQTQRGARSVMVASALPAEGKTLTSTNLALTLSHSYQRRVLLIDADLRRPCVHLMFRLKNRVGLVDGLKRPELIRLPVRRVLPTLWVLTAGAATPDPMSALVSDTMKHLILEATQQFDWVVIDTPAVALMPDANLLASMIDTALLVVNAGSTPYPLAQRAIAAIGAERLLGVVLNRAERADGAHGHHYGYAYGVDRDAGVDRQRSHFRFFGSNT